MGKPRHRWEGLECVAAVGTMKQLSHKQILYLDHTTDNTNIARVVKNGKAQFNWNCVTFSITKCAFSIQEY